MIAIRFEHVAKSYPKYQHMLGGLKAFLLHLPRTIRSLRSDRFTALRDVSFEIRRGETVGLIGPNGSGKSTMLALIAGVLRPDAGTIEVHGRVCPLLELGAGFHPELTGRENIVLNGVLSGLLRRELLARMADIIAFSELSNFIDQPIRTYSSGMLARLGFSVAVHLDPEVLLIDEILAVGDQRFRLKCRDRIGEFRRRGVTIVVVSHAMDEVRLLCDRVMWLQEGSVRAAGDADTVVGQYVGFAVAPAASV